MRQVMNYKEGLFGFLFFKMHSIRIVEPWGWTGVTVIISHPPRSSLSGRAAGYEFSVCAGNWLIIKITCQTKANAFIIRCPPQVRHGREGCAWAHPECVLNKTRHVEINDMSQMCSDTSHKADYTQERTESGGKERLRFDECSRLTQGNTGHCY